MKKIVVPTLLLFTQLASPAQELLSDDLPFPFSYDSRIIQQHGIKELTLQVYRNVKDPKKLKKHADESYLLSFDAQGKAFQYLLKDKKGRSVDTVLLLQLSCNNYPGKQFYELVLCDSLGRITLLDDPGEGYTQFIYQGTQLAHIKRLVPATEGASSLFINTLSYDENNRLLKDCYARYQVLYGGDSLKSQGQSCDHYFYENRQLMRIGEAIANPDDVYFEYDAGLPIRIRRFMSCDQRYDYVILITPSK